MPCNVELVVAVSLDEIAHQVHAVLEREHPSPMRYWLSHALITVMARHQKVEMFSLRPLLCLRAGEPTPGKSCNGLCLVRPVDAQCVFHASPAKPAPPPPFSGIFICARIDRHH